jgi:hypothetical protein
LGPRTPAVDQVHDVGRRQVASEHRAQGFLSGRPATQGTTVAA